MRRAPRLCSTDRSRDPELAAEIETIARAAGADGFETLLAEALRAPRRNQAFGDAAPMCRLSAPARP